LSASLAEVVVAWTALGAAARYAGAGPQRWLARLELGSRILTEAKLNMQPLDRVRATAETAGLLR